MSFDEKWVFYVWCMVACCVLRGVVVVLLVFVCGCFVFVCCNACCVRLMVWCCTFACFVCGSFLFVGACVFFVECGCADSL